MAASVSRLRATAARAAVVERKSRTAYSALDPAPLLVYVAIYFVTIGLGLLI